MFGRNQGSSAKKDLGAAYNAKKKPQVDTSSPPAAALAGHAAPGAKTKFSRGGSFTRPKSPRNIPSSAKPKLPTVTMDDLFGVSRPGKVGAPIIDMGYAYEAEDVVDVYKGNDYATEFNFGSPLDIDGDNRAMSPITLPVKEIGSKSKSSAKGGAGSFFRRTVATAPFTASKSSFEAVFRNQDQQGEVRDFEMESPFMLEAAGQVKEAAVRVLYQQNEPIEDKARKLFFLDQLNKPAPPVVPPRLSPNSVAVAPRKSYVKRKKGVRHGYDPTYTALGITGGGLGFCQLIDVVTNVELGIGWRLRVEVLRDIAQQLMKLHNSLKAHNSLDHPRSTLLAMDTFRGAIADEKATVQPRKEDTDGVGRMKRDLLFFGALLLQACIKAPLGKGKFQSFEQLLALEKGCKDFNYLDDTLYGLVDSSDREVREALAIAATPGSLLELCAQCCSGDRLLRPAAEDAWDWLDSIVSDMDKAAGASGAVNDNDKADKMTEKLKSQAIAKNPIKDPKLADVFATEDDYNSDATSTTSDIFSITSNDSFQPPPMDDGKEKRKSKLSDFISASTAEGDGGDRGRPHSLNLTGGKLSVFLNPDGNDNSNQDATVAAAGNEAWQNERTRRRSLDRGYMWAKQKFDEADDDKKSKRMTRRIVAQENIQKFEQAWKVAAASTKTRKAEEIAQLFQNQERLPQDEALGIIKQAEMIMKKEKNLLELKPPVVIVGDIHGQFFDLLNMMKIGGEPGKGKAGKTTYLFLGDYVDRGDFSCEVLLYLLALKGEYPESIFLLRGNHECRTVSSYFGFKEECEAKYGLTVFNRCVASFQVMPIAALVETQAGRFLCCHGGISPNITSLEQFKEYNRFVEPGMNGFLCDLLWSDPVKDAHEDGSDMTLGDFLSIDYLPNPARGCSYRYGFKALVSFLAINKLVALIRAHEVQMAGYRYHFQELTGGKSKAAAQVMPPVVTIFSAPNYTNKYGNLGAFLRVHANPPFKPLKDKSKGRGAGFKPLELLEPVQFSEVPHPPPMQHPNQQAEQVMAITSTCPYMPTTFHAFIKRAVFIAELDNDDAIIEREKIRASRAIAPVTLQPKKTEPHLLKPIPDTEEDELDKLVRQAEQNARPKSLGAKMLSTITGSKSEESPEVVQVKADVAAKKNWKALQQLGLDQTVEIPKGTKHVTESERLAAERFESAAENDGMNEMNPALLAEKVELAKLRIAEKHLQEDVTVFKAGAPSPGKDEIERRSLGGKKRSSARLKVGDKTRPESMKDLKSVVELEEAGLPSTEEGAMSFSSKELLALQMLFLLIDRQDKGLIDEDDLIAWSAEEGYAVQKQEAEICLRAVDADEDGKIGFEDYLAFAARSKDQWLVGEYSNLIHAVQDIKMQRTLDSFNL